MLWHIAKFKLTKLQRSPAYDVAIRLPVLGWSAVLTLVSVVDLEQYAQAADPVLPRAIYAENIVMRLSVIAYLILLASAILVRMRPVKKARGAEPRISAFMGTFLITLIVLFPRCDLAPAAGCVSTLLVLLGDSIATAVLIQLRRSFSIMAEARQLTISGAYRFVRHPLYLAEEVATIGSAMQFLSIWTAMLLIVQIACQIRRIRNEEIVLMEVFPEYSSYRRKTPRIIPRLY